MLEPLKIDELPCELMVNGYTGAIGSHSLAARPGGRFPRFDDDHQIGSISLHDGFELEIGEQDSWRTLTLEQLKKALAARSEFLQVEDIPKTSGVADAGCLIGWTTLTSHIGDRRD